MFVKMRPEPLQRLLEKFSLPSFRKHQAHRNGSHTHNRSDICNSKLEFHASKQMSNANEKCCDVHVQSKWVECCLRPNLLGAAVAVSCGCVSRA